VNWFRENDELAWWLAGISAVVFVGSLVALREALIRIPPDYFNRESDSASSPARRSTLGVIARIAKNILGALLLIAGLLMLFTPGQGILAIVLGVSLLDVPGKRALQRRLVGNPKVLKAINKMRIKAGRTPLDAPRK
jgi:hypothetical protein